MYEKEIEELNKKIAQCNNKIKKVEEIKSIKYMFIAFLMVVGIASGFGIGVLISQPFMTTVLGIALSGLASGYVYENGIKGDQAIIDTAKMRIKEYKADIERYKKEQAKSPQEPSEPVDGKGNKYKFSKEFEEINEKFDECIKDFFDTPGAGPKKR